MAYRGLDQLAACYGLLIGQVAQLCFVLPDICWCSRCGLLSDKQAMKYRGF
jgi:hypothetical protein